VLDDTVVDRPVLSHGDDLTELEATLPEHEVPLAELVDPPPPPLIDTRGTGWIPLPRRSTSGNLLLPGAPRTEAPRHVAFPLGILAASLVLFVLALTVFAWLAWG